MQDCIAELERTLDVVETDTARAWLDVDLVHARRRAAGVDADDTEDEPALLCSMPRSSPPFPHPTSMSFPPPTLSLVPTPPSLMSVA
jgi:hypothetical protein